MEPNSSEDVSSNNTTVCPIPTNKKETISKDTVDIQFSIDLRAWLGWVGTSEKRWSIQKTSKYGYRWEHWICKKLLF